MSINISNGFDTFNTFVQFAAHRSGAGLKGSAVKATLSFDNRNISAVEVSSASKTSAGWFSRTDSDKSDNDRTRDIFRAAIVKMFGGESKIPPSVVKAMEMENYGHGRPLTARRILLVKAAIDHTDAPLREYEQKFQSNGLKILGQLQPETKAALFSKGYTMAELPNIARAVKAYNLVTGALPLGKLLMLGHLLLAVLAEGGHEAPGGINGEGLPALLAGLLQRNRGFRYGGRLRLILPEKAADLFQQFHDVLLYNQAFCRRSRMAA